MESLKTRFGRQGVGDSMSLKARLARKPGPFWPPASMTRCRRFWSNRQGLKAAYLSGARLPIPRSAGPISGWSAPRRCAGVVRRIRERSPCR